MSLYEQIYARTLRSIGVREGIVIEHNEAHHSATSVSGGGSGPDGRVQSISSNTTHYHDQRIWIRYDDGAEEDISFRNMNVSFREGHRVRVVSPLLAGGYSRIVNLTTGQFWRLGGNAVNVGASHSRESAKKASLRTRNGFWAWLFTMMPIFSLRMLWYRNRPRRMEYPFSDTGARISYPLFLIMALALHWMTFQYWNIHVNEGKSHTLVAYEPDPETTYNTVRAAMRPVLLAGNWLAEKDVINEDHWDADDAQKILTEMELSFDEAMARPDNNFGPITVSIVFGHPALLAAFLFLYLIVGGIALGRVFRTDTTINTAILVALDDAAGMEWPMAKDVTQPVNEVSGIDPASILGKIVRVLPSLYFPALSGLVIGYCMWQYALRSSVPYVMYELMASSAGYPIFLLAPGILLIAIKYFRGGFKRVATA